MLYLIAIIPVTPNKAKEKQIIQMLISMKILFVALKDLLHPYCRQIPLLLFISLLPLLLLQRHLIIDLPTILPPPLPQEITDIFIHRIQWMIIFQINFKEVDHTP